MSAILEFASICYSTADTYEPRFQIADASLPVYAAAKSALSRLRTHASPTNDWNGIWKLNPVKSHIYGPTLQISRSSDVVLASGLGGTLETGRTLNYLKDSEDNRKMCSLYLSLMDRRIPIWFPSGLRRIKRNPPPTRKSTSHTISDQPRGPNQRLSSSGLRGTYREIDVPYRSVHTESYDDLPGESEVITELTERDAKTVLRATITYTSQEIRDAVIRSGVEHGAAESYDRLAELLEAQAFAAPEGVEKP
jgi:uncharacterized protein YndB with AHSA1/START domain